MFATLSGRIQRPEDCLEIECLFDHAMRDQTTKRFSEPLRIERIGPGRRPSIPEATTLRDVQTGNRVRIFRAGPILAKKLQLSLATVKVTVLGLSAVSAGTESKSFG